MIGSSPLSYLPVAAPLIEFGIANYLYTASGTLNIGSTSDSSLNQNYLATGTLNIGSTSTALPIYLYTATGTLRLGDNASVQSSSQFVYAASGTLNLGNTVTVRPTYLYTANGTLILGSTATVVDSIFVFSHFSKGNGVSNVLYFSNNVLSGLYYSRQIISQDVSGGSANIADSTATGVGSSSGSSQFAHTASGTLNLGSTAVVRPNYLYTASGTLNLGSTATVQPNYLYAATGTLRSGSTSNSSLSKNYLANGTLNLGSTTTVQPNYLYTTTGTLNLGSTATVQNNNQFIYAASGNLNIGNTAIIRSNYLYVATGMLNISSTATILTNYLYTATGSIGTINGNNTTNRQFGVGDANGSSIASGIGSYIVNAPTDSNIKFKYKIGQRVYDSSGHIYQIIGTLLDKHVKYYYVGFLTNPQTNNRCCTEALNAVGHIIKLPTADCNCSGASRLIAENALFGTNQVSVNNKFARINGKLTRIG